MFAQPNIYVRSISKYTNLCDYGVVEEIGTVLSEMEHAKNSPLNYCLGFKNVLKCVKRV